MTCERAVAGKGDRGRGVLSIYRKSIYRELNSIDSAEDGAARRSSTDTTFLESRQADKITQLLLAWPAGNQFCQSINQYSGSEEAKPANICPE